MRGPGFSSGSFRGCILLSVNSVCRDRVPPLPLLCLVVGRPGLGRGGGWRTALPSGLPGFLQSVRGPACPAAATRYFFRVNRQKSPIYLYFCAEQTNQFMTRLSVNINKVATLRNARGGNMPDLLQVATDCEKFGADGITVHPRPDERHIRRSDVLALRPLLRTEFNIEGYPSPEFKDLVLKVKPHQVTLVPDAPTQLTSNSGWDTKLNLNFLSEVLDEFNNAGVRTSVFVAAAPEMVEYAAKAGADRVELYTGPYAVAFAKDRDAAVAPFVEAAKVARSLGLGLNAGHDLNLTNLKFFLTNIPWVDEVSIGHALICDALYLGLERTIQEYKKQLV